MRAGNAILIVVSGARRYALLRSQVLALTRAGSAASAVSLAASLGDTPLPDERYTLAVAGMSSDTLIRCGQVELRSALPCLDLPPWLAQLTHPAVIGLVLDDADLVPLVDLVQLALETGYKAL